MNIAVAQSGGPTCAINSSLAGVIKEALQEERIGSVFGSRNGIEGIINDRLVNLDKETCTDEWLNLLKYTPASVLGSCRIKLRSSAQDADTYKTIFENFKKNNIGAFFYIGGNDSMDTVQKLSEYAAQNNIDVRIIGIPKTIDNDVAATDHTPGYGSAAKYIATTAAEIIRDSAVYNVKSVTIIEIMGRDAGWLTAAAALPRANNQPAPDLIYLPETAFSTQKFIDDINNLHEKQNSVVVAVSEGLKDENGEYAANGYLSETVDVFGHQYLAGLGKFLENLVKEKIGCKVRAVELNVMQRCSSHLSSKTDLDEAELIGAQAVKASFRGVTGKMMIFRRISTVPYKTEIDSFEISTIANKEKLFPVDWINDQGNNINDEAVQYILPLIQGEVQIPTKNGLPVHITI
ncbi:MAG: 6-phosphofructokinase [Oscillospiraceae bacterium]|nr:6-phosphofructokinase [Oscillospiraceae bacterium]